MSITGLRLLTNLSVASALALSACGGDKEATQVTEDTNLLVRNAAFHSSSIIGVNMNSIVAMTSSSTVSSTLSKITKSKSIKGTSSKSVSVNYFEHAHDYLLPTLEGGNASGSRSGNTISIDPDENYICQQWIGTQTQGSNFDECVSILRDLTVSITATSDNTGTLSYLYSGDRLFVIEYAPDSGSYELFLPGVAKVIQREAEVSGDSNSMPDNIAGAIKLTANIDNANEGNEAGKLTVSITQPIQISGTIDNERVNFSLGRSTLFSAQSNAATGNGNISLGVNAFYLAAQNLMGAAESATTTIELPDFTLSADLDSSGTEVLLSNVGMSRGPFRIAIENNNVVSIALDKFSVRYNDLTREAEFLSALDLNVAMEYTEAAFGWLGDGSSLNLSALVPAGTLMTEQLNGSTKVERGGPFSYQVSYFDGSGDEDNFEQDITFAAGQCFDESYYDERLEIVSCE